MSRSTERRKFRRFEIPGGTIKIGKVAGYPSLRPFSNACSILNACVGGVNIISTIAFSAGDDLLFELHAPGEKAIRLRSKVVWTSPVPLSKDILTGFELSPFGEDRDLNPPEAMGVLRRLYARYIKG